MKLIKHISKIIELGNKSKIEFEHVQVKTKNVDDNTIINISFKMVFECDVQAKQERLKGVR